MSSENALDSKNFSFLLPLRAPSFNSYSYEEYIARTLVTVVRYSVGLYDGAPHGLYVVSDDRDGRRKEIFSFVTGTGCWIELALAQQNRRLNIGSEASQSAVLDTSDTARSRREAQDHGAPRTSTRTASMRGTGTGDIGAITEQLRGIQVRMQRQPLPTTENIIRAAQAGIIPQDCNSLWPLNVTAASIRGGFYVAKIQLNRKQFPLLAPRTFHLPIDTGSPVTWFYGEGFMRLEPRDTTSDPLALPEPWSRKNSSTQPWQYRLTVPRPPYSPEWSLNLPDARKGEALVSYIGGNDVYIRYHERKDNIQVSMPSWDWVRNQPGRGFGLSLPRTLAYAANDVIAQEPYDGNLGLSVPGVSYNVGVLNVETIDQALASSRFVNDPRTFHIRLLHPDTGNDAQLDPEFTNDFLCFEHFPCEVPADYGPVIPVAPDANNISSFSSWRVRLNSMTLLVPREDVISHDYRSLEHFHSVTTIPFAKRVTVVLDTGSTNSVLPVNVPYYIQREWLIDATKGPSAPRTNLEACDILFKFEGKNGSEVQYRAPAARFLRSPWFTTPDKGSENILPVTAGGDLDDDIFVLGINSYWCAFVQHVAPERVTATRPPYIRLAPQRILDHRGRIKHREEGFKIMKDLPPALR
ncbi:hypothetical protein C8Q73DRAFT_55518 [Cubamyces lactineus]|nr:hypothetical protein C8Q73DRAFT_55518 [Cubamyces lactineus]